MQLVDGRVLLTVNITDNSDSSEEPTDGLTDDEYAQINEAVNEAFGDVYDGDVMQDGSEDYPDAEPTDLPAVEVA